MSIDRILMKTKNGDCGICAFAMAAGITYEESMDFFQGKVFSEPKKVPLVIKAEMTQALMKGSVNFEYLPSGENWENLKGNCCLLCVMAPGFFRHWIVYVPAEDRIYDPNPKVSGQDKKRYKKINRYYAVYKKPKKVKPPVYDPGPPRWVHKYSPKTLEEMCLNDHTRARLNRLIESKQSAIIYAPAQGMGLTICADILRDMNIWTVLDKVPSYHWGRDYKLNKDFRYIVWKEPNKKQRANYIKNAKRLLKQGTLPEAFLLTTKDINELPSWFVKRLQVIRFRRVPDQMLYDYLCKILTAENKLVPEEFMWQLIQHVKGDIQRAINILQNHILYSLHSK